MEVEAGSESREMTKEKCLDSTKGSVASDEWRLDREDLDHPVPEDVDWFWSVMSELANDPVDSFEELAEAQWKLAEMGLDEGTVTLDSGKVMTISCI